MDKETISDLAKHQIELFKILGVFLVALISGNAGLLYKLTSNTSDVLTWVFFIVGLITLGWVIYFSAKILLSILDLLQKLKE